ncbi:NAD-glutamate dehydrogenase [Candidatus Endobugula sertula]|uniref:NAD-glutamate dehydrogenase n=1 Tax=Candidatus Endobugula sertula TaxID=62101 RepID=A0A1D2QNV3_9GAMM|nr:NAD-glutamate dehydrogenase [Candidatus Endobugula sertula]
MNKYLPMTIDELLTKITSRLTHEEKNHLDALATHMFNHIDHKDIEHYKADDLEGLIFTWYRKVKNQPEQKAIIFNPNVEEHGWQSAHTVIILHHTDVRYLINSIRNTLNQHNIKIHTVFHSYLPIERNKDGSLKKIHPSKKSTNELLLYIEIDHHSRISDIKKLRKEVNNIIKDVNTVAQDYQNMCEMIDSMMQSLQDNTQHIDKNIIEESKMFLHWLRDNHFTFLAYSEYIVDDTSIKPVPNTALGLFRQYGQPKAQKFENLSQDQLEAANENIPILFSKSGHLSSVHRAAYSDYVVIKKFNKNGKLIGGHQLMGLYKHNVYLNNANDIPIIRTKIASILKTSKIPDNTYNYAELSHILGTFPRDELFQASTDFLLKVSLNILYMQERAKVKLFLRESLDNKFINAIVYAPRERLSSSLQEHIYELLSQYIDNESSTTSTWFSESPLARCRFVFKLKSPLKEALPEELLERKVVELARDWNEDLQSSLVERFGEEQGITLYRQYRNAFPASYTEENSPRVAVNDIDRMQTLSMNNGCPLSLSFYRNTSSSETELKIKIYHKGSQLSLSDMIPILENFGLKIIEELPYNIEQKNEVFWIYNFTVDFPFDPHIEPIDYRDALSDAFIAIWQQQADNDNFNELVLKACLTWRQVSILRAYSQYMKQINIGFSQRYIATSLINHTNIAKKLISLFDHRFNPQKRLLKKNTQQLIEQLEDLFEQVASLSEDRILRQYLELLLATLRTNFFQKGDGQQYKEYISFKLSPNLIKEIPLPCPKFEIFVYSPRVQGVHLRGGDVSRGGLRWSDRTEDFRTEILGLVKAQQVKNAVIVPVGAKGGFITKRLPTSNDRDAFRKEGIACYKLFIRGLLDLTDNIKDGKIIPPTNLVRHDGDDTYLVVAADKGTATFSDIANEISMEYDYWLGDAFASGGSNGYDHKKMGITARGAWISVQRHFRKMGINIQEQECSVVGIGDMSGDVFGNGMLLSDKIKLVGAFNHLHIFIDPTPNPATSFAERQRLFALPRSSWIDYDTKLISEGGNVFSRSSKFITLTPQIQALVRTEEKNVTPSTLISLLLKSPVDMLWNGGIGTYVKASTEQHHEIEDKANDSLRINANELQCKVIGEGGNLGLSQQARIEYGLMGGAIFTDFIDNAGGVDCSDHEVNIKILLDKQVNGGELTTKQRNRHLESMAESVAMLALRNNYQQTQAISLAYMETDHRTEEYLQVIKYLESTGKLNRKLEFIPSDECLMDRKGKQQGLTQAELSILISYVKADMKEALMSTDLGDDQHLLHTVESAFPKELVKKFRRSIHNHPLRKEITATQIANDIFNHMSISYVDRIQQSTGADHSDIAKTYVAAKEIFSLDNIWSSIELLDYVVKSDLQYHMMLRVSRLIRRASRWLIKNHRTQIDISTLINLYANPIQNLSKQLPSLLPNALREQWQMDRKELTQMGAPKDLANTLASCRYLYDFLGIIAASNHLNEDITIVASSFFTLAESLELDIFSEYLREKMPTSTLWQSLARESLRDDLEWQQRQLVQNFLSKAKYDQKIMPKNVRQWLQEQDTLVARWRKMVIELKSHNDNDMSIMSIAIRELSDLSQATA